jgi:hypothetical protein
MVRQRDSWDEGDQSRPSSARPGFPIRIWDTAVLAAASVHAPFLESAPRSERADDGGHVPHHYRPVCQRRRQIPDRGAQRGVDECPRRRTDKRTDGHLPQRNSDRPNAKKASASDMPGMKRCPTTPTVRVVRSARRCGRRVSYPAARALSRPARPPTRLATIAMPTAAPSVTKMPSTGPNRSPLPAARIAPGTNNAPRTADTTT